MSAGNVKVSLLLGLKNKLQAGLGQAKKYLNSEVGQMKAKLKDLKVSHIEAFKSMQDEIPVFGRAMELLGNPYALLIAGVLAVGAAMAKASAMATEFNTSMAKANVTAQESPAELKKTADQLLDIISRSRAKNAIQGAPEAYNVLLSSGLDKNTALGGVEDSLNAAKAGFTDVTTAAKAAASVMNSSGVKDTTKVYDVLFATMRAGNAEFQDIAQYLPKIIPAANSVGVSLDQVSGAYAFLTAQGQTAERSATLLENAFKVLGDPKTAMKFKAIGVEFFDQAGKMRSLADISGELSKRLNGLTDEKKATLLDSLGLDMESRSAFLAMSQDAGKLKDIIDQTTNSTGALKKAVQDSSQPMDSWDLIMNKIDVLWVKMGTVVNNILGALGDALLPVINEISNGTGVIGTLFSWIGEILTPIWNIVSFIAGAIWEVVKGVVNWVSNFQPLKDMAWLIGELFKSVGVVIGWIGDVIEWLADKIKWLWDHSLGPVIDAVQSAYGWIKDALGLGGETEVKATIKEMKQNAAPPAPPPPGGQPGQPPSGTPPDPNKDKNKPKGDAGVNKITGQSQQSKVININIKSFVENFSSKHEELRNMSKKELERWFMEMLNRAVHSIDTSYE